jgi:nitroreductase
MGADAVRAFDLIRSRRSVRAFEERPVPPELLHRCLEAAVWAPNEGLRQPWRFVVLGPLTSARWRAAVPPGGVEHWGAAQLVGFILLPAPDATQAAADRLAIGAAIQNTLLCAWEEGLAGLWLGQPELLGAAARTLLGLADGEELAAVVVIGYPESVPPRPPRTPAARRTTALP